MTAPRYDDGGEVPLGGYAALATTFTTGAALFAALAHRRGVRPPEQVPPWDVALLGTAVFKASRLISKDKITSFLRAPFTRRTEQGEGSEVMDAPRGGGAQRAVGDLVSCPFCVSAWVAGVLVGSYAVTPRGTRLVCAGLTALTAADWLQYAWTWAQQSTEG
ncbi:MULTISPECIES: DUF1360 domain-containing protein [unclassified Streptomyces]|uniref:DUF1360 domain-containing protein n=1 Tax=unclassified Streptomyces TaxID=2593676 RepID=UPI003701D2EA